VGSARTSSFRDYFDPDRSLYTYLQTQLYNVLVKAKRLGDIWLAILWD